MTAPRDDISRRDFIRETASATLMGVTGTSAALAADGIRSGGKTRVVLIRDQHATDKAGRVDADAIQKMLDDGVLALLGEEDIETAWKQLIKPTDIVGIKSNVWRPLPTPAAVEQGLVKRVCQAGVAKENVAIDDRRVRRNPGFKRSTALINARPMRTHHWAGLGGCIKNYIMFVPKPFDYHGNFCSPLGKIWQLPMVKGKTRLNVLVLLTPLFHGVGPHHYDARYTWRYNGLLLSKDPVAVDAVGRAIIKAHRLRFFGQDRPFKPPTRHIEAADQRYNIGTSDLNKIELVKLGWSDGVLI